jgi:transcriptional antiterminator RfaH
MNWYLVHTKPRQEGIALENLQRQGYACYLPVLPVEKVRKGQMVLLEEPLFPRYLFIQLGLGLEAKSWSPIRSTLGVSTLVRFGMEPAKVDSELIDALRAHESEIKQSPQKLFEVGQKVVVTHGPFAGVEGIFQMRDGQQRVMVLIELMSKSVPLKVDLTEIKLASSQS